MTVLIILIPVFIFLNAWCPVVCRTALENSLHSKCCHIQSSLKLHDIVHTSETTSLNSEANIVIYACYCAETLNSAEIGSPLLQQATDNVKHAFTCWRRGRYAKNTQLWTDVAGWHSSLCVTKSSLYRGIITGVETAGLLQVYNNKKIRGNFSQDGLFPFLSTDFPIPSHSHSYSQTRVSFPFPWDSHGNWESHSHGHL